MKLVTKVVMALAVLIFLSACATDATLKPSPAEGYSFFHKDFDLHYAWKTEQSDQGLRVAGLLKNVRNPRIESVEVNVALLDKSKKTIAKGTYFPARQPIDQDDYRPFDVVLKGSKISEGDLLQFIVNYVASAGQSSFTWTSSFTVDAKTGAIVGVGRAPDQRW